MKCDACVSLFAETLFASPFALLLILWEYTAQGVELTAALPGWKMLLLPAAGLLTLVPMLLFSYGMQRISLSLAGVLMYINPTLQLLVGVFFYGEEFTVSHVILFAFVWTGIALYLISGWRERYKLHHAENGNHQAAKEEVRI